MFEDIRGKKLLIIGDETNIQNIVAQAREMGVYTVVTERGSGVTGLSAKAIADEAWNIDYSDTDTLSKKCAEAGISGVFTGYSEGKVYYAALLARRMGWPFYVTPEQVEMTRNKRAFKDLCVRHGIPVPREYCPDGDPAHIDRAGIEYPIIVKPADYGGRIGISVCRNGEELEAALEKARSNSVSGTVVAEEFVTGMEMTAIYTLSDGEISLSIMNDKYLSQEGNKYAALCDAAITPSRFYSLYMRSVDEKLRALIRDIGVRDGIAVVQCIATEEKITAFEMGLCLNGGNDWKILSAVNGINHMKMLIHHSLTGNMGDSLAKDDPELKEYLATYVMYAHDGVVGSAGCEGVAALDGILDISPYVYVGKTVPDRGTTQQRVYSFKIRAKTLREMAETVRSIQMRVSVKDTEGRDMMFTPFDTDRLFR